MLLGAIAATLWAQAAWRRTETEGFRSAVSGSCNASQSVRGTAVPPAGAGACCLGRYRSHLPAHVDSHHHRLCHCSATPVKPSRQATAAAASPWNPNQHQVPLLAAQMGHKPSGMLQQGPRPGLAGHADTFEQTGHIYFDSDEEGGGEPAVRQVSKKPGAGQAANAGLAAARPPCGRSADYAQCQVSLCPSGMLATATTGGGVKGGEGWCLKADLCSGPGVLLMGVGLEAL